MQQMSKPLWDQRPRELSDEDALANDLLDVKKFRRQFRSDEKAYEHRQSEKRVRFSTDTGQFRHFTPKKSNLKKSSSFFEETSSPSKDSSPRSI